MKSYNNPYRAKPYVMDLTNAPAFWLTGILWRPFATGIQTGNHLSLIHQEMPQGPGPVAHMHPYDEYFYIIEGEFSYYADSKVISAVKGDAIFIPRNVPHSFNIDKGPASVLNFYTPAGFELLLMSLAIPAKERRLPKMEEAPMPPPDQVEILSKLFGQINVNGMPFIDGPHPGKDKTQETWSLFQPYKSNSNQLLNYSWKGNSWKALLGIVQTGGSAAVFERKFEAGDCEPTHFHGQHEAIYIINGELLVALNNQEHIVKTGSFIYIPENTIHRLIVEKENCTFINIYTPGYFEQLITTFGKSQPEQKSIEVSDENSKKAFMDAIGTMYLE